MTDASRTQGWAICTAAAVLGLLFLIGILSGSYLALAIPVSVVVFFGLGLAGWVGYTIATIRVEPEVLPDAPPAEAASATPFDPSAQAVSETASDPSAQAVSETASDPSAT